MPSRFDKETCDDTSRWTLPKGGSSQSNCWLRTHGGIMRVIWVSIVPSSLAFRPFVLATLRALCPDPGRG